MSSYQRTRSSSLVADEFELRYQNRNSEDVHNEALTAAYEEHRQIREAALRATELHQLRMQQKKRQLQIAQAEERVRVLEEQVREQARLQEVEDRERQVPTVPPPKPTPPPSSQLSAQESKGATTSTQSSLAAAQVPAVLPQTQLTQPAQSSDPFQPPVSHQGHVSQPTSQPFSPLQPVRSTQPTAQTPPAFLPTPTSHSQATDLADQVVQTAQPPPAEIATSVHQASPQAITILETTGEYRIHGTDRFVEIHKKLKELRKFVNDAGKENKEFKKVAGELRRGLRSEIGKCVMDKSKNREPARKIFHILEQSLTVVPSPGVDASMFVVEKSNPVQGARHNGEQLPALFIYLLNYLAKYVVNQLIGEASVKPDIADPIGVVTVQIFSRAEFLWRGESLIDILMAKIRMTCPVLFGIRGSENTEEGRARLGWKRENGSFIEGHVHWNRMIGLAAGYAAICLRDFSKAKAVKSPWRPYHYWQSMACIVATPPSQRSPTTYIVLRAMIDGYEDTFLKFYGAAAVTALTAACVTFPLESEASDSAVPRKSAAVGGLEVLADKLLKDRGIRLRLE